MAGFIIRVIIAVLVFAFLVYLIPLLLEAGGIKMDATIYAILRLCGLALAVLYIFTGTRWHSLPPYW